MLSAIRKSEAKTGHSNAALHMAVENCLMIYNGTGPCSSNNGIVDGVSQ